MKGHMCCFRFAGVKLAFLPYVCDNKHFHRLYASNGLYSIGLDSDVFAPSLQTAFVDLIYDGMTLQRLVLYYWMLYLMWCLTSTIIYSWPRKRLSSPRVGHILTAAHLLGYVSRVRLDVNTAFSHTAPFHQHV